MVTSTLPCFNPTTKLSSKGGLSIISLSTLVHGKYREIAFLEIFELSATMIVSLAHLAIAL